MEAKTFYFYLDKAREAMDKKEKRLANAILFYLLTLDRTNIEIWSSYKNFPPASNIKSIELFLGLAAKLLHFLNRLKRPIAKKCLEFLELKLLSTWASMGPQASPFFLYLGYFALDNGHPALLIWAFEKAGNALALEDKQTLSKIYLQEQLFDKALQLALSILEEDPHCVEVLDLIQAAKLYQNISKDRLN